MKASVRKDLKENGDMPVILIGGMLSHVRPEWMDMHFECFQPNVWDNNEWNLILMHPVMGIFLGNSIDWDFNQDES
jgi:hypothetical protein